MAEPGNRSSNAATRGHVSLTAMAVIVPTVLLLLANLALGYVLVDQSAAVMKSLINQRMLDISNTAANMLDGDSLKTLRPEDKGTEPYQEALNVLATFKNSIDLEYIYGVRQTGEDSFVFTIDPDPNNPGEFGSPVVCTDALKRAAAGTSSFDDVPYEDKWGRFYSSYSPVFDSNGEVAGIVAVDFDAMWYDNQIAVHTRTAAFVGVLSLCFGGGVVFVLTSQIRRKFHMLYDELSNLAEDVESLNREAALPSVLSNQEETPSEQENSQESSKKKDVSVDDLAEKVRTLQAELRQHIQQVRDQAYTDILTGVGSKVSYVERIEQLSTKIQDGSADFCVIVFDINGLKQANDTYGHDEGDRVIIESARAICQGFGIEHTYRVGGDEFIVVAEGIGEEGVVDRITKCDETIAQTNLLAEAETAEIAVSKGYAVYDPTTDEDYQAVSKRADHAMYDDKAAYYRTHADRRRR